MSADQSPPQQSGRETRDAQPSGDPKKPAEEGAPELPVPSKSFSGWLGHLWSGLWASANVYHPNIYAIGLVGVAFAVAIILFVLKKPTAAVIGIVLAFAGMILLLVFRRMAEDDRKPSLEARFLTWVVIVLTSLFLICLFTAFVFGFPSTLAKSLGIGTASDDSAELSRTVEAIRTAYAASEDVSTTASPNANYNRLRQALFRSCKSWCKNPESAGKALVILDDAGLFRSAGYPGASEDFPRLNAELNQICRWRRNWLETSVLPALTQKGTAIEATLPREAWVRFNYQAGEEPTETFKLIRSVQGEIRVLSEVAQ